MDATLEQSRAQSPALLELALHDHPHALLRLMSLLSRRAVLVDAILSPPAGADTVRPVHLLLRCGTRLGGIVRQLEALEDVLWVRQSDAAPLWSPLQEIHTAPPVPDAQPRRVDRPAGPDTQCDME